MLSGGFHRQWRKLAFQRLHQGDVPRSAAADQHAPYLRLAAFLRNAGRGERKQRRLHVRIVERIPFDVSLHPREVEMFPSGAARWRAAEERVCKEGREQRFADSSARRPFAVAIERLAAPLTNPFIHQAVARADVVAYDRLSQAGEVGNSTDVDHRAHLVITPEAGLMKGGPEGRALAAVRHALAAGL